MYYANWGYTAYGWMMKEGAGFKGRPVHKEVPIYEGSAGDCSNQMGVKATQSFLTLWDGAVGSSPAS